MDPVTLARVRQSCFEKIFAILDADRKKYSQSTHKNHQNVRFENEEEKPQPENENKGETLPLSLTSTTSTESKPQSPNSISISQQLQEPTPLDLDLCNHREILHGELVDDSVRDVEERKEMDLQIVQSDHTSTHDHDFSNHYQAIKNEPISIPIHEINDEQVEKHVTLPTAIVQQHSVLSSIPFLPVLSRASPSSAYPLSPSEMQKTPATIPPPEPPDVGTDPAPSLNRSLSVVTAACCAELQYTVSVCYRSLLTAFQVFGQRTKWPVAVLAHIIIDERGLKFILGGLSLKAHSLGEQILSIDIDDYHCQSWSFGRKFGVGSGIFKENKSRDEHLASIVDWKNVGHGNYSSTSMLNFDFLGPGNSRRHVHFGVISPFLMCFICSCVLDVYEEFREAGPTFCNLRTYLEAVSVFVLDGSMMPIYAHVRTIGVDTAQILREDSYTKVPFNFKEEEHLQEVFATLTYFPQDSWSTVMHSKNLDFEFRLANDGWPNNSKNWFDLCCASDSWVKFYIARKYVSSNNSATEKKLVAYWAYFIDSTDGYLKSLLKSNTLCFYSKYNTYSGSVEFKFQLVNTWTAMYSNYEDPFDTCKLINVMPQFDVGTWIALINGFDQNRFTNEVGCLFKALIFAVGVVIALISFEFEHTRDIMPIKSLESKQTQLYFITGHLNCYSSYTMLHEALEGTNPLKALPRTEVEVFTLLLLSSGNGFQVVISCDNHTFTDMMKDALLVPYGFCIIPLVSMFNAKGSPPKFKHVKMDAVLHRKMIYNGIVQTTKGLLKWKTLPLKHGTCEYSSLRTRMF